MGTWSPELSLDQQDLVPSLPQEPANDEVPFITGAVADDDIGGRCTDPLREGDTESVRLVDEGLIRDSRRRNLLLYGAAGRLGGYTWKWPLMRGIEPYVAVQRSEVRGIWRERRGRAIELRHFPRVSTS